jgi:hypothetical protein
LQNDLLGKASFKYEFLAQNHKNSGSHTGYYLDKEINGK